MYHEPPPHISDHVDTTVEDKKHVHESRDERKTRNEESNDHNLPQQNDSSPEPRAKDKPTLRNLNLHLNPNKNVMGSQRNAPDTKLPFSNTHLRRKRAASNLRDVDEQDERKEPDDPSTGAESDTPISTRKEEAKIPSSTTNKRRKVWRSWGWEYAVEVEE